MEQPSPVFPLETQGLISVDKQTGDARLRRVTLTPAGRAEFMTYDGLSDELAVSMLAPLGQARRDRLVTAMTEVETSDPGSDPGRAR